MRSNPVNAGDAGTAAQYDNLRDDAYGGSLLLTHQQTTPGMTLYVEPGTYYIGTTRIIFAGGSTPTFTAPVTYPRIDLVTADSTGTIAIVQGTEASTPVAPAYPSNKVVLCEVHNVVGETALYDLVNEVSGQGYISNDVRPFVKPTYIGSASQVAANLFIPWIASPVQGDIAYFNGTAWARLAAGTANQALLTQGAGANPIWAIPEAFTITTVGGGGSVLQDATNSESTSNTTPTKVKTLTCNVAGRYTFNCLLQIANSLATANAALYKNGTQVATTSTTNSSATRLSFGDFQAAVADVFDLYIWTTLSSYAAETTSFQVEGQYGLQFAVGGTTYGFVPALAEGSFGAVPTSNWTITLN